MNPYIYLGIEWWSSPSAFTSPTARAGFTDSTTPTKHLADSSESRLFFCLSGKVSRPGPNAVQARPDSIGHPSPCSSAAFGSYPARRRLRVQRGWLSKNKNGKLDAFA